jgi:hypothetical protein
MEVIILFIGEKRKLLKRCVADFSTLPFYIDRNSKTRNYIRVKYLDVLSKVNLLFRLMLLLKICLNQRQSMLSLLLC